MNVVQRFYDEHAELEWARLARDRVEFAVTLRALREHLPAAPSRVLDIGGGPGRYSLELTRWGYDVVLADFSASELAVAQMKAGESSVRLRLLALADARQSPFQDAGFDAVLMLGPLYHLADEGDRRVAVGEAMRVVGPGGRLFAAFITRYAPLRYWAKQDPSVVATNPEWWEERLVSGRFGDFQGFTDFHTVHPKEVVPFMESCGLRTVDLLGCEGVVSMIRDRVNELEGEAWDAWVDLNYRLGHDESTHGCAEHLLYVGDAPR